MMRSAADFGTLNSGASCRSVKSYAGRTPLGNARWITHEVIAP
jgi:hypothetical protein